MTLSTEQKAIIAETIDYRHKGSAGHQAVLDARTGKKLIDIFSPTVPAGAFRDEPITALLLAIQALAE